MHTLSTRQVFVLVTVGIIFWALATAQIHWMPSHIPGVIDFALAVPVGWLSVWITQRSASLTHGQLPAGVLVTGAVAMMIDGVVLRWAPDVYSSAETMVRMSAASLLWGYGIAFAIAVLMSKALKG